MMKHNVTCRLILTALLISALCGSVVQHADAGDGATIIFREGHVMFVDNGFTRIADAMKDLNKTTLRHRVVEFNTGQGNFVLNVAEVRAVCRDKCKIEVLDLRDPIRGATGR